MDTSRIILVSCLPRSGSTLLQNLLAQNPANHCTSTNDVLDMIMKVRDSWMASAGFMAQGLRNVEPRVRRMLHGMVYGFYEPELAAGRCVFDKSRGWLANIELIEQVLGRPVKIIVTVRDIRDILASFERIYRKSRLTGHPTSTTDVLRRLTVQGRAERLCAVDGTVGYMLRSLEDVLLRNLKDRLVIVPYYELTHDPINTIARVCYECNIPKFFCDPMNVQPLVQEDDTVYGMYDLHAVQSYVVPQPELAWQDVLPDDLANSVDVEFKQIQELGQQRFLMSSSSWR